MIDKLKIFGFGAILAALIGLWVVLSPASCSRAVGPENGKRVDTVLVKRTDTLHTIDTLRKTRIKYIDTSHIDTVHDILDSLIPIDSADNDGNQVIAANQLREAVKWKDSLNTCIEMRKVDSVALDTLGKLAKQVPDTIKPPITQRLKDVGIGFLLGLAGGRFF